MSVIRYVSEEEVDEETSGEKQEEVFNETIMQRPPKVRVAICGPARAGKTFVLNAIEQSYLERFDNPLRHYMHLNKILLMKKHLNLNSLIIILPFKRVTI